MGCPFFLFTRDGPYSFLPPFIYFIAIKVVPYSLLLYEQLSLSLLLAIEKFEDK